VKAKTMTKEQVAKVDRLLEQLWDDIYDNILTSENKDKNEIVLPHILLQLEEQIKSFSKMIFKEYEKTKNN